MSEDTNYNGWSNYETWNYKLWIDNDESTSRRWDEIAKEINRNAKPTKYWTSEQSAICELSDMLKKDAEDNAPVLHGAWGDLITSAISRINWKEIATAMIEDAKA